MEILLIIAGVLLLILNICMVVKFFQIAKNVERLTNLYVDGQRDVFGSGAIKRYKLPLEEISKEQSEKERDAMVENEIKNKKTTNLYNSYP